MTFKYIHHDKETGHYTICMENMHGQPISIDIDRKQASSFIMNGCLKPRMEAGFPSANPNIIFWEARTN